ncbi:MAG: hypothetical protein HFE83_06915 [Lachnospiraceae bacterium]|jgi:hypothetical protein|nr:hypothetical protein [Lachnospiraceae bacterium]
MFYGKLPILLLAEVTGRSGNSTNCQIAYMEQADEKDLVIIFRYTGIYFDYEYSQNRIHPNIKRPKIYFVTGNPYVKKVCF